MQKLRYIALAALAASMISCGGSNNQQPASQSSLTTAPAGEGVYKRTCITCHQANGQGIPNTFPPLAKSDYLGDKEKTILQVIKGSSGEIVVNGNKYNNVMPPQQLSDEEIASVLSYVYSSFGNSGGSVTADEVKNARAKM